MLWTLVKIRLKAVFNSTAKGSKKKTSPGMKVFVLIMLGYAALCLIGMCAGIFNSLSGAVAGSDYEWVYFAIVGILMLMLGFFSTVFAAQSQLFEAKDNELLLSMPIPVRYILISRILTLLVIDGVEDVILAVVAAVIFATRSSFDGVSALILTAETIGIMLLTSTLSTLFGWIFAAVTSKMKNKAVFTTALSFAFIAAYFIIVNRGQQYVNYLLENGQLVADKIKSTLYPFYSMGYAITNADFVSFALFMAIGIIPFIIVVLLLTRSFIQIATAKKGVKKKAYRVSDNKVHSTISAFTGKELRRFGSSGAYMVNAGLGLIMMVIAGVLLIVKHNDINNLVNQLGSFSKHLGIIAVFAMCIINFMNMVSSPSVSLEGESIWIPQSLPVNPRDPLMGKVLAHVYVCTPFTVFLGVIIDIFIPMSVVMKIAVIVVPLACNVFVGFLGVVCNILLPKLDWEDETVAIKQSMSVLLAMVIGFGIDITVAVAYVFLHALPMADVVFAVILLAGFILASIGMYNYLGNKGAQKFMSL